MGIEACLICEALGPVNSDVERCPLCRTHIGDIAGLSKDEFRFDWLSFHCCPCHSFPPPVHNSVRLVVVTMEPPKPGQRQEPTPVMGGFRPLKYALARLLLAQSTDGFLVSNVGKCSLAVKMAKPTMQQRWKLCCQFLRRETDALTNAGLLRPDFVLLSIGNDPLSFLNSEPSMRNFSDRCLGLVTHYGAHKYGKFEIASSDKAAFAQFRVQHEADYRSFVKKHVPWDLPKLDRELTRDMEILFKWDRQMEPWKPPFRE